MYTENNNGSFVRDIVLKVLFLALFIFLLLWLYPRNVTSNNGSTALYDSIFNENINYMKETAIEYYTVQRLPQEVGKSEKLTLKEMLDMKLLLPFVDKDGDYCNVEKSYVKVTKLENDEYELKVNLSCNDNEDYILVYLGCHDLCVDGKCEKVLTTISYEFSRELLKGRKWVKADVYKYEYTKQSKVAYTADISKTYYKGKKKISEDTYSYEYTKTVKVPYTEEIKTTYYMGTKTISEYSYEYKRTITVTTPGSQSCVSYYNQSYVPSNAVNVTSNQHTVYVTSGYSYGNWTTVSSFSSTTPVALKSTDTERTISNGYQMQTGVCTKSNCPESKIIYYYLTQTRTKKTLTSPRTVTTYNYEICTSKPGTTSTSTETQWFTTNPGGQWVATGNSKVISSSVESTDWVTSLPEGYTLRDTKVVVSTQTKYKEETKTTWSTKDLTGEGWTKTGSSKIITVGQYDYTDWVTSLPEGYTQTDKKTVTEKETRYKDSTEYTWSTKDLTNEGWTKTGNKVKSGETGYYEYTNWVTSLPAGYEQCDKKTETKWSTQKTLEGWTVTGNSKKIEE